MVRSSPFFHALSKMFDSRICSRLFIGSDSMPMRDRRAVAAPEMRSRMASRSSTIVCIGSRKRLQQRNRNTRAAAGRVDCKLGRRLKPLDTLTALPPLLQAFAPQVGLFRRKLLRFHPLASRIVFVDPGLKIFRPEIRKLQQEIADVALGIDYERRNTVDGRFLEQIDAKSRLAAAGHSDANGVRYQVPAVIQHCFLSGLAGRRIVFASQIERSKFFDILHVSSKRKLLVHY